MLSLTDMNHSRIMPRLFAAAVALFSAVAAAPSASADTLAPSAIAASEGPWDALRTRYSDNYAGARALSQSFSYDRAWLDALPVREGGEEWACLAEALYFEARGETIRGQFAVAEVIMNRVDSARYPNTVCDVVNQGTGRRYQCQFTYTCDGHPEVISERAAYERVGKVAWLTLQGVPRVLTDGAMFYHTTAVSPSWARRFERTAQYGVHIFYRRPTQLTSN